MTQTVRKRVALSMAICAGLVMSSARVHAGENAIEERDEAKIRQGFELAPVPLAVMGRDPKLVGLGSYIVNAQGACNDCHSAGPQTQYVPAGNPYFGQSPAKTNPATYLGGGRNFGPLAPNSPNIISRNLTPDKTGRPIGGDTFQKFVHTMKTGEDPDHVHLNCSAGSMTPCLPGPFDGALLQIMPWPVYGQMTFHDLLAVYEYLSAIPCVEGGPGEPADRCR